MADVKFSDWAVTPVASAVYLVGLNGTPDNIRVDVTELAFSNHNHDGVYAPVVHNHDADYVPLDGSVGMTGNLFIQRTGANPGVDLYRDGNRDATLRGSNTEAGLARTNGALLLSQMKLRDAEAALGLVDNTEYFLWKTTGFQPVVDQQVALGAVGFAFGVSHIHAVTLGRDATANLEATTKQQMDTGLAGKSDTGHTHVEADITDLDKYTQAEVDTLTAVSQYQASGASLPAPGGYPEGFIFVVTA